MHSRALVLILVILFFISASVWAQHHKCDISKLTQGMTTNDVKGICGRPDHINRYGSPQGESEQWVYKESRTQELYLYFENGLYTGDYQRFGEKRRLPE